MANTPHLRNLLSMIQQTGLTVVDVERSKHYKVTVKAGDGRIKKFSHGVSLSDHRALANARSDYRRFARGDCK